MIEKLCPKCATGKCLFRNGIMCRADHVCARDDGTVIDSVFGKEIGNLMRTMTNQSGVERTIRR